MAQRERVVTRDVPYTATCQTLGTAGKAHEPASTVVIGGRLRRCHRTCLGVFCRLMDRARFRDQGLSSTSTRPRRSMINVSRLAAVHGCSARR